MINAHQRLLILGFLVMVFSIHKGVILIDVKVWFIKIPGISVKKCTSCLTYNMCTISVTFRQWEHTVVLISYVILDKI